MPPMPSLRGERVVRALGKAGFKVARRASVRRPWVAVILAALHDGARHLSARSAQPRGRVPAAPPAQPEQ